MNGRLPCSFMALALLGSLAAQSQLGDHDDDAGGGGGGEYLRSLDLAPPQHDNDELLDSVAQLHRTHGYRPTTHTHTHTVLDGWRRGVLVSGVRQ